MFRNFFQKPELPVVLTINDPVREWFQSAALFDDGRRPFDKGFVEKPVEHAAMYRNG